MQRSLSVILFLIAFVTGFLVVRGVPPGSNSNFHHYDKGKASGGLQALEFWSRSRAYPYAEISSEGYYRAYEYSKQQMKQMAHSISTGSTWKFIGPNNSSGRMLSVAIDPTQTWTIYAGSA